jgi:hypothetical protein
MKSNDDLKARAEAAFRKATEPMSTTGDGAKESSVSTDEKPEVSP